MFSTQSIVHAWDVGLRYALALLAELSEEQLVVRPGGNMNHPAWILGHISLYHPIVPALFRGESFEDPADDDLFGFRGRGPLPGSEIYGTKSSQINRFIDGHELVAQSLLAVTPEQLCRPPCLTRWAEKYPTVELLLPEILILHESLHIGQLSSWRRAVGLPGVEFPDTTPRREFTQPR